MAGGVQLLAKTAAQKLAPASRTGGGGITAASPAGPPASLGGFVPASGRTAVLPVEPAPALVPPELTVPPGLEVDPAALLLLPPRTLEPLLPPEPAPGFEEVVVTPPVSLLRPPTSLLLAGCPPTVTPPDSVLPADPETLEDQLESLSVRPPVSEE
jgi:hypothetical protein